MHASIDSPFAVTEGAVAHVLLFTGHMVDAPDRPANKQRFPRTPKAEQRARQLIASAIQAEIRDESGLVTGIASGANGGDILFHETCHRLGVRTAMYLPLSQDLFQAASVRPGGSDWVERFQGLCSRLAPHVLQPEVHLPHWLTSSPDYNMWHGCNYWMLQSALATASKCQTLIALINSELEGNGVGGTSDFVKMARERGVKVVELDARALLVE